MEGNFFALVSRLRYIHRWSLMRSSVPENVAEHSHQTAVIAHALGLIRRDVFHRDCDPNELAAIALYHDATEILTGDLPTPIKYYSSTIRGAYSEVEDLASDKLCATLPGELRPGIRDLLTAEKDPDRYRLVKAADKLSALIQCIEERKAGNREFLSAEKSTRAAIAKMALPEADYFVDHFIPAFELDLDELGTIDT